MCVWVCEYVCPYTCKHECACVSLCVHVRVSVFVCVCACMSGNLSTCHKGITSQTPIEISHLLWQAVSLVLGPGNQSSSYAHTHSHTHKHTHTHTHTHTLTHTHCFRCKIAGKNLKPYLSKVAHFRVECWESPRCRF